ncbi:MAG: aspartate aminotransferase family protein [Candidatus Anammoxibacter sp.]
MKKENNHYIGPEEIIRKKKEYLIPCTYHFFKNPMQIVRGEMQYLYDHTGKQYIDCYSGVSVVGVGHCNPEIAEKTCEQVRTLQHTTTIYLTQPIVDLAERLASITPGKLQKSFFCVSGTEANEGALLLAQLFSKKHEFIALNNGLSGRSKLTMSLTGLSFWRTDPTPVGGISFAPNPYCYRCTFGLSYPQCDLKCAEYIKTVIESNTSKEVAAMIVETIQGNGGVIVPPPDYFKRVKEILDHYGILLIIDEVQSGFGRTGKMFAIEHWDVEPDIMTVAKTLGNGIPIGAFITNDEIASSYTRPGASTFGGNPVAAVTAIATLDVINKYELITKAEELGNYLKERLLELKDMYSLIGDVRGKGLFCGAELVKDGKEPATEEADIVLEHMKDHGVLVGKTGRDRNVITFQPPLVIKKSDIEYSVNAFSKALLALQNNKT